VSRLCSRAWNDGHERYRAMANNPDRPMIYQIRIEGHLGPRWSGWFEGLTITPEEGGETLLSGPVVDQAALHGLLRKVRDLGMPLISAIRVEPP
jgi:hypothetical protein